MKFIKKIFLKVAFIFLHIGRPVYRTSRIRASILSLIFCLLSFIFLSSCHYLDIVPDDVATIDYAFRTRHTAEKYLFTCYSYLPKVGSLSQNPAWMSGDEFWIYYPENPTFDAMGREVARGNQNVNDPYFNFWDGSRNGTPLYKGIRDCNTFLANIDKVPDLEEYEKNQWIAEVKFLKAWYNFWLVRMYGPIVIQDKNLPVSSSPEDVKLYRQPVDSCFRYIIDLIDQAIPNLPDQITDRQTELGRITKAIALSEKAKILVYAASPLFNGSPDYANFTDDCGVHLFNPEYDSDKWDSAAKACKEAIDFCQSVGIELYHFQPNIGNFSLSDTTITKMSIRNAICEKWNQEIIWADPNNMSDGLQREATPTGLDPSNPGNQNTRGNLAIPIKIAEMFYTNKGLPINEDKTWDYNKRFSLRQAVDSNKFNLQVGYTTASLNFDRGLRFYADLGFDGSTWYGQGRYDDNNPWYVEAKAGQASTKITNNRWNITGYWPKKLVNYQNIIGSGSSYTIKNYPWPIMRLADLYLLYAEALNEVNGPGPEVYEYIDAVRSRAGIPPVEYAWTNYSRHPNEYKTKDGMRKIIHRERLIELAFEGQRFWDLRRWKEALTELNNPITGWHIDQEAAAAYYQPELLFNQTFQKKDYLWPLREEDLIVDKNLVQNPGW